MRRNAGRWLLAGIALILGVIAIRSVQRGEQAPGGAAQLPSATGAVESPQPRIPTLQPTATLTPQDAAVATLPLPTELLSTIGLSPTPEPSATPVPTLGLEDSTPVATPAPATAEALPPAGGAALPADVSWVMTDGRLIALSAGFPELVLEFADELLQERHADTAPGGQHFAYSGAKGSQLLLLDAQTGQRTRWAQPGHDLVWTPRFSPDGSMLVFTSAGPRDWRMFVLDIQTQALRSLLSGTGNRAQVPVAWTPQGILTEQLLLYSDAPPQTLDLLDLQSLQLEPIRPDQHLRVQAGPDGSWLALVEGQLGAGEPPHEGLVLLERSSGREAILFAPEQGAIPTLRWSPGGGRLVYTRAPDFDQPPTQLAVVSSDGTLDQQVELAALGLPGAVQDVAWRDEETLQLLVSDGAQQLRIYTLPAAQLAPAGLAELGALPLQPGESSARFAYIPR